ncbi:MAG TPA: AMP-binding protein [Acidimicrobiales bacterium]|nr:AMP-binding protein [Acidimicrobiales bacterium]
MSPGRPSSPAAPGPHRGPRRLRPTLVPARSAHYRRPGGPWDGPSLDAQLSAAARSGASAADDDARLGGDDLEAEVAGLAGRLRAAGAGRGRAVAWQLPNGLPAYLLYRACWRLGAVAAPLHHGMGPAEVASALDVVGPSVVLAAPGLAVAEVPGALAVAPNGRPSAWEQLPDAPPVGPAASPARPPDLAAVLFTSGSSGAPKAVLHTQRALAYKARLMASVHGLGPADAVLMPAPLAHVSGLLNGVLLPGTASMACRLMARWDPERACQLIESERVSFMIGPPTFFVGLIQASSFSPGKVASLRLVSSGGASVTPAFVESATAALGCRVKRTYGSTEAPTVTTTTEADPEEAARQTDGRAVGEVELKVADTQSGRALPPGGVGELWLRGPELFVGYADPAQTRASHARGGWFRTGDLASLDGDGFLRIVGRIKDVIIRGGENVSAAEVEAVLEAHPSVAQAVAVPYPDQLMGERVAAFVVARGDFDLEECRRWFAERGVARFKTPERLVRLESMPTMAAGKPDRAALRRMAAQGP